MKRPGKRCGQYEESLCLLASGALPEPERARVEEHLVVCTACQRHYAEIRSIAKPLANWEKAFAHIEPAPAAELRWGKAIKAAGKPAPPLSSKAVMRDWWRELIWSCRHAWAGMAAVWLVLWGINLGLWRGQPRTMASQVTPTAAVSEALAEQRQLLVELITPANEPRREPVHGERPRPRSEIYRNWRFS